jgi:hypothetical protein
LSDQLPDLLRTETLLTVGQQLIALHDEPNAHFFLRQVALIGARAPHLTSYYRRSLLEQLIPAILRVGGGRDDWISLAKTVESGAARVGNLAPYLSTAQSGRGNRPLGNNAALVAAQDARRAAAANWLAELSAARDEARRALHQALLAEDTAVNGYLEHTLALPARSNEVLLAAEETRLHWLLLKRRIAEGGAGPGLVPEWESSRERIRTELTAAWADWLARSMNPKETGQGQAAHAVRRALVAAYWGLYADAPVVDLVVTLQGLTSPGQWRLNIVKPGTLPMVGWSASTN